MPSSILSPTSLLPSELDLYLSIGWRPMGQRIYTADFIQLDLGHILSVIPTRMSVAEHSFKKKQARLLRKNGEIFTIQIDKAERTSEMDRVNELYMELHPTKSPEDLNDHLLESGRRIFDTQQVSVFYKNKLVAFSFFDVGENSVYSKAGIYDPGFSKQSLGMYTLFLEIEWAQKEEKTFYYPGYISPDTPLFDYKTKIGSLQFRNTQTHQWIDYENFEDGKHNPNTALKNRLLDFQEVLKNKKIKSLSKKYIFFETPLTAAYKPYLGHPYFLYIHSPATQICWVVCFDLNSGKFEFLENKLEGLLHVISDGISLRWPIFTYFLRLQKTLYKSPSEDEMSDFILKKINGQKQILSPIESPKT